MDRNSLNLKELKAKNFDDEMIVLLTKIALDDTVTDEQFDLCTDNKFSNEDELDSFYSIIKQINKYKYDITDDIKNILTKDSVIREAYFSLIRFTDDNYKKYITILNKYYNPKYKEKGIELLKYIFANASYTISKHRTNYSMHLSDFELEEIYRVSIKYCLTYKINADNQYFTNNYNRRYIDDYEQDQEEKSKSIFDIFLYLCRIAKMDSESDNIDNSRLLSSENITNIGEILFGSEKLIKNYYKKYISNLELLVTLYINKNVSYNIIKKYIGSVLDYDSLNQHITKENADNNPQFKDHIDQFIFMMQSMPNGWYDRWNFEYLYKLRFADKEKLRIILNPSNTEHRIQYFCSGDIMGCTRYVENFDNSTYSSKVNSISMRMLQEYFDPIYTDNDISYIGEYIIYADKNSSDEYIDLVFNNVKSLLVPFSEDEDMHLKVIRLMDILLGRNDNRKGNKEDDSKFITMMKPLITKDIISKQYLEKNGKRNDDRYYIRYNSGSYTNIYKILEYFYTVIGKSNKEIMMFYNEFNNFIFSRSSKKSVNNNIDIDDVFTAFNTIKRNEYHEYTDYINILPIYKDNLTVSNLILFSKLADKLHNKLSYKYSDLLPELILAILILNDNSIVENAVNKIIKSKKEYDYNFYFHNSLSLDLYKLIDEKIKQ